MIEAAALSFVAGWVDTVSFLTLRLFTSHITGNFVLIFVLLAAPGPGLLGRLLSVPVFVAVVYLVTLAAEWRGRRRPLAGRALLALEAVLLGGFMLLGVHAQPLRNLDTPEALLVAMVGVAAMAVQNAGNRLGTADRAVTTVMTTNISQLVVDVARATWAERGAALRRRLDRRFPSVVAFAVGCAGGAGADRLFGFWGLLAPVLIVAATAALTRADSRSARTASKADP